LSGRSVRKVRNFISRKPSRQTLERADTPYFDQKGEHASR